MWNYLKASMGMLLLIGLGFVLPVPILEAGATVEGAVDLGPPPRQPRLNKRYGDSAEQSMPMPKAPPAVVYLEGDFAAQLSPPAEQPALLQQGLAFHPRVLPVVVGTTVSFPNDDDTYHNVFSYSPAKRFDLGRYRGREGVPTVTFDEPGVVKVFCEIHNHMRATILVLETPYFVTTDEDGKYQLENLPPGKYTLTAWVNDRKVLSKPVDLKDEETVNVNFGKE